MIFNLFKSKPTLKELIPNGFVDIHSHILPGIDDGAKNVKESIELISEMKKIGFSKIIGTPHTYPGLYENTNKTILKSYDLVIAKLKKNITIDYASEYMLDNSILTKIEKKSLLTLSEKYVLVEMSYFAPPYNLYEILFELITNKYVPILAHPERYRFLHNNFKEYEKLKKVGCLFQINLLSLTSLYGPDVLKISKKLYSRDLVDFTGSDIHNHRHLDYFNEKVKIDGLDNLNKSLNNNIKIFK